MNLLEENNKLSQLLDIAKSNLNNQNLDYKQRVHSLSLENNRLVKMQSNLTMEIESSKKRTKELENRVLEMLRNLEEEKSKNSALVDFESKYMQMKMSLNKLRSEKDKLFESKSMLERVEKANIHKVSF
jgi:uncharacterized phage infection (PIP) family protein YhgE